MREIEREREQKERRMKEKLKDKGRWKDEERERNARGEITSSRKEGTHMTEGEGWRENVE